MKPLIVLLCVTISGCGNKPIIDASQEWQDDNPHVYQSTSKIFVGVPGLLSMEGSSVRLNDKWVLTNRHNRMILALQGYIEGRDVFYHPDCDIAIYYNPIKSASIGLVYLGDRVVHSGYPVFDGYRTSEGEFIGDVVSTSYPNCKMSMSTGGVRSGMSGGGVWDDKGELVGLTVGYLAQDIKINGYVNKHPSVWVSLNFVSEWLGGFNF